MGLIKTRPRLKVLVPSEIRPGQTFTVQVLTNARRSVAIDGLRVLFSAREEARIGEGQHARVDRRSPLLLEAKLTGKTVLEAGERRFDCTIRLPESVSPSYDGKTVRTEYLLTVEATIPWWFDAKQTFEIPVRLAPVTHEARPGTFSSAPQGARASEPHAEISLSDQILSPGYDLAGAVALSNVAYNHYTEVVLRLEARETALVNGDRRTTEPLAYDITLSARDAEDGEPIPFRLRVPEIAPSVATEIWQLAWVLRVLVKRRLGRTLELHIPVVVLPRGSKRPAVQRAAVQSVGSARVRAIWQRAATEHGFSFAPEGLVRRIEEVDINVRRDHRGDDGVFLVVRLRYPNLGLALDGGRNESIWRFLGKRSQLTWPKKGHYVTGRELAQVSAFVDKLRMTSEDLEVADISDEELVVERRDSGQSRKGLSQLLRQAQALASRLVRARAAIPVPAAFAGEPEKSWNELVEQLRGRLETARMAVFGQLFGRKASVVTEWTRDGEALATHLSLEAELPITEREQRTYTPDTFEPPARGEPDPKDRLLAELLEGALMVEISERELKASVEAPLLDARQALSKLNLLSDLELALRGRRGAYR